MTLDAIASAIYNNVYAGTTGLKSNPKISIEQLKDECIAERNTVLREYLIKGGISLNELYHSINCVEVDCDYMSKCCDLKVGQKALHFEIPPIIYFNGVFNTIRYIGSIDHHTMYKVYTDESYRFHSYKKRGGDTPYVYIDTTINSNGNIDGYIFNVPFVKYISVIALFQDPRKLLEWDCCSSNPDAYLDFGVISNEVIRRMTEKYVRWFRQLATKETPNNQMPS